MNMNNEKSSFTIEAIAFLFLLLVLVMSSYSKSYGQTRGGNIFQPNNSGWETCAPSSSANNQLVYRTAVEDYNAIRIITNTQVKVVMLNGDQSRRFYAGKPYNGLVYNINTSPMRLQCNPGYYTIIVTGTSGSLRSSQVRIQTPVTRY